MDSIRLFTLNLYDELKYSILSTVSILLSLINPLMSLSEIFTIIILMIWRFIGLGFIIQQILFNEISYFLLCLICVTFFLMYSISLLAGFKQGEYGFIIKIIIFVLSIYSLTSLLVWRDALSQTIINFQSLTFKIFVLCSIVCLTKLMKELELFEDRVTISP